MKVTVRYFPLAALHALATIVGAQELDGSWWFVNGTVQSMARAGDTLFVGGVFDHICPPYSYGAVVDTSMGSILGGGAYPDGIVFASAADGAGGWFIGGTFDLVGDQPRYALARINSDGSLHPWAPVVDYNVHCMELHGDTLYVGGSFNTINGQTRNRIAAFSISSGTLLPPVACTTMSGGVNSMSASGGMLYFGGSFTSVCGQPRSRLAAIDIAAQTLTAWTPSANGDYNSKVEVVKAVGNRIYVGGGFDTLNAIPWSGLAALDLTGAILPWAPMVSGTVTSLIPIDDELYVAGAIDSIGGVPRRGIGAVDTISGALLPWEPAWSLANNFIMIHAMEVDGNKLYLGGSIELTTGAFDAVAIDRLTGSVFPWSPNADDRVRTLCLSGGQIYCGGWFSSIGRLRRQNGAAFSISSRQPLAWDPRVEPEFADVWALAVLGDVVYLGGSFHAVGGGASDYLAGVDRLTGDIEYTANASAWVNALEVREDRLFVGGSFQQLAGGNSPYFAQLTPELDSVIPWTPAPDGTVAAIHFYGDTLFLGGWFDAVGGEVRSKLAAIDISNSTLLPWAPQVDDVVRDIRKWDGIIYLGGDFTMVDNISRTYMAAVEFPSGTLTPWSPVLNDRVTSIDVYEDHLYATGAFYNGSFVDRVNFLAAYRLSDAERIVWDPEFGDMYLGIESLLVDSLLFVGGNFFNNEHTPRQGLVAYDLSDVHTSLVDVRTPPELIVWPNPVIDVLHAEVAHTNALFEIVDAMGRLVFQVRSTGGYERFDVSGLASGPYMLRTIHDRTGYLSRLFVKR